MKFNSLKKYLNLPFNIYILFIAGIITASGNFVFPFLTLFLTKILGLNKSISGLIIALIFHCILHGFLVKKDLLILEL